MIELGELQREWLRRRAFQAEPEEACGFLMADGKFIEIQNINPYPYKAFSMSAGDISRKINDPNEIQAIWHTHPSGSLDPSGTDMDFMYQSRVKWSYIIATKSDVRIWAPNSFAPQPDSFWEAFSK